MKLRTIALALTFLSLAACSKTTTENSTTTEVVSNTSTDPLNLADNASDLDAGNATSTSSGNAL